MPDGCPRSEGRACFPTGARHAHRRMPGDSTLARPATVRHRTSQPVRPPLSELRYPSSVIRRPLKTGNAGPEGPAFPYAVRREHRPVAAMAPAAIRVRVGTRLPGRERPDNGAFHTAVECGSGSVRAVLSRFASDLQGIGIDPRSVGAPCWHRPHSARSTCNRRRTRTIGESRTRPPPYRRRQPPVPNCRVNFTNTLRC